MTTENKNLATVNNSNSGLSVPMPEFLEGQGRIGTDVLSQYVRPPRLKIVQPASGKEFKEKYATGDVIASPSGIMVAPVKRNAAGNPSIDADCAGNSFFVTPIFVYPEFCAWNPASLRGNVTPIRERSLDPNSAVAKRARDFQNREIPYPENPSAGNIKYCEHLNYVCYIWYNELLLDSNPLIISFARAEFRTGAKWGEKLIIPRNKPIFSGVYEMYAAYRSNDKGQWYGLQIQNPSAASNVSPWVPDATSYAWLGEQHAYFAEVHRAGLLQTEYDDSDVVLDGTATATQQF